MGARHMATARRAVLLCSLATWALAAHAGLPAGLQPLPDDDLAQVRGADGISFNLQGFSLTSNPLAPLSLNYIAPSGVSLTLSGLNLSRSDDADPFADPFTLDLVPRPGMTDMIAIGFPANASRGQLWQFSADFSTCGGTYTVTGCSGNEFLGGSLSLQGLSLQGGGLYISTPAFAATEGIAFGLGTRLDIDRLTIQPRGLADTSEQLQLSGIHLFDAATGGPWMLADVTRQPGLLNAMTDAQGSYLHLQVAWPQTADPVPAATLQIDNLTFQSNIGGTQNFGASTVASMQINYLDIKFRPGP